MKDNSDTQSLSKFGCQICENIGRETCMHGCLGCNKQPVYFIYMSYYPTDQAWQANYCRDCFLKMVRSLTVE